MRRILKPLYSRGGARRIRAGGGSRRRGRPQLAAGAASALCPGATTATFGPNVCVFTPGMSQADDPDDLNAIATQQVPVGSQFDSQRYSVFFEPGTYGSAADPLVFQVGYYTQVAGLGALPQDTVVNGVIDVLNNLCTAGTTNCNADDNFWRSLSNLTLNVHSRPRPPAYAPPVVDSVRRRVRQHQRLLGGLAGRADPPGDHQRQRLLPGLLRDPQLRQRRIHRRQPGQRHPLLLGNQQYIVRNSSIGGASGCPNGLWNMVYSGVQGARRRRCSPGSASRTPCWPRAR